MKSFEYSANVIPIVAEKIREAGEYVRVAIFQLHNSDIFDALDDRLRQGIKVEIFTLPYDSINEDIQSEVVTRFKTLERNGAKLLFCRWNVGDPERTTTTVGRWYSFHGKFIVTERCAISLSANFTKERELDALIIYDGEKNQIQEYNQKFEELNKLFVLRTNGYDGNIRQKVVETGVPGIESVFDLPAAIETETHKTHWIKQYPSAMCPTNVKTDDKLYLTPFDCRGRDIIKSLISMASDFVYLSTESFTDGDFCKFLLEMRLKGLDIRIISGSTSMDFTDRIESMFRELLARDIRVRAVEEPLHGKLIVTDRHVAVSSINLNKINLGFATPTKQFWRENTETLQICSDPEIIGRAKHAYLSVFSEGMDMYLKLTKKVEKKVGDMFASAFKLKSKYDAKRLFATLLIRKEIDAKRLLYDIGSLTAKVLKTRQGKTVERKDFISALVLFYLSERMNRPDELREKLGTFVDDDEFGPLLVELTTDGLIEETEGYYRIRSSPAT